MSCVVRSRPEAHGPFLLRSNLDDHRANATIKAKSGRFRVRNIPRPGYRFLRDAPRHRSSAAYDPSVTSDAVCFTIVTGIVDALSTP